MGSNEKNNLKQSEAMEAIGNLGECDGPRGAPSMEGLARRYNRKFHRRHSTQLFLVAAQNKPNRVELSARTSLLAAMQRGSADGRFAVQKVV
jgi:hypothetical protein